MSVQVKYQSALNLGTAFGATDGAIEEVNGVLKVTGTVATEYEKNQIWDEIKAAGGDNPTDIIADIKVANTDYYAQYTVEKGDTLGKIAKHFYGEPKKYTQIFNANTSILEHPDKIEVGQILTIPFEV